MDDARIDELYQHALTGKVTRRTVLRRAVAFGLSAPVIGALLAACGGGSSSSTATSGTSGQATTQTTSTQTTGGTGATSSPASQSSSSAASPSAAGTPAGAAVKPTGKITITQANDLDTLDPHMSVTVNTDLSVASMLYTGLIIRDADLQLRPSLATSWKATSDTVWEFKLRDDVVFPSGEKLDATAVKWNIDRVLDPKTKARVATWFAPVQESKVVDATTLQVTTKQPYPAFADQLSQFYLLPPKWTAEHNSAKEASGTGPYNLKEWIKDDHLTMEAKPTYWGSEPVPFQTVIFRAVPEASSRVSGLLAGDFEIITPVQPSDYQRINSGGKATAGSGPSSRVAMVNIHTKRPPFDNVKVRQALNHAVDKEGLIKALFTGFKVAPSPGEILTDAYFGFNPDLKPYAYDPDMAKKLMKEAGVNGTVDVEFWVPIGRYLLGQELTQAIAGQLEDVGIKSKINELPFSVFLDTLVKNHDGMGTLAYITYAWPTLDADGQLTLLEQGSQYSYWDNQQYTQLLAQARSTTDQNKRKDLYKQATQVMRDDAPVIFLFPQPFTYAAVNTIDWHIRPDDWVRVYDMKRKG